MTDILLAKTKLPDGWLDLSVGEPHVVKEALFEIFPFNHFEVSADHSKWEYPYPYGIKSLVQYLENKHNAPIVIVNGAKQGLGASFYALKKMGYHTLNMRRPYWCLLPPIIETHGLNWNTSYQIGAPQLLVYPNNPDNYLPSPGHLSAMLEDYKADKCPIIFDAAYFSSTYVPCGMDIYNSMNIGDVQIYSISKLFGLSGIRLGYVVCHNTEFYKYICEYMEMMTVGVSTLSQEYLLSLYQKMDSMKYGMHEFLNYTYSKLYKAKLLIKKINKHVLEVPSNMEDLPGMFAFLKLKKSDALINAKINAIDGALFGMPGYVRLNLAVPNTVLEECVNRINDANTTTHNS